MHRDASSHTPNPRDPRFLTWVVLVSTLVGLGKFAYLALDDLVRAANLAATERLIEEMTGAYGGALLFVVLYAVIRRYPLRPGTWHRRLLVYVFGAFVYSAVHTALNWASRELLFPVAGLGSYDYGAMPLRFVMELPNDLVVFVLIVLGVHGWFRIRAAREREVRAAKLEADLARAELRMLQMQLQPHFLFNSLNTISEHMYEDVEAADEMIGQLSELLRHVLRSMDRHEITLEEEIAGLEIYVALLSSRFGDAVRVNVDVDDGAASGCVPALLLQPIVENAVTHAFPYDGGTICIRGQRQNGHLCLVVADDGRGVADAANLFVPGHGLYLTRERLRILYGEDSGIRPENRDGGGFTLTIDLPFRETCAY